ncbi:uncharacterized protein BKCO1_4900079 [Diplodia corticola]|uniref:Uncharacterized protein n=1 Tax=Diplodia corticola TaxID=236234 RepID=A0A1J9RV49_9PEZI|nr:uncharacterized protein BKCO1_4900079 [Diplodia corticola]OJD31389.1 hypothetical protein BKCO1_4900079 [Diplodia corticola]
MPPRMFQPTCETDESSDEGFAEPKSQPQSNVSAKRSSQNELRRTHGAARPNDLTSDSGYSSRTAATGSSADSAKSSNSRRRSPVKTDAPPAAPEAPAPPTAHARPRLSESSKKKSHARESPKPSKTSKTQKERKPVVVRQSSTRTRAPSVTRPRRDSVGPECEDPNCDRCLGRLRIKPPPLKTGMEDNYSSYTPRSPRVPPSPGRPPIGYNHPFVETQIAGSTTRSQIYSHQRPLSYYSGSSLSDRHNYPQMNHGPPPTMWNPQYAAMMGAASHAGYYGAVPSSPLSASYESRPPILSRASEGYPPRPSPQNLPNPRYGPLVAQPLPYQPAPSDDRSDEDEDESGHYRHAPADHSRSIMGPPPRPTVEPPRRRPSLRSQTTSNVPRARPLSVGYYDRVDNYEDDLVEMTHSLQLPHRRSSVAGSNRNSYYPSVSRGDRVTIQPSRSDRPRDSERERTRINTVYNRDVAHLEYDDTLRRDASADDRRKDKLHSEVNKVEAYLNSMNGNSGAVADSLRTNAARGRASSNATRPRASSHSQHSYDGASRISDGARSTSTRKTVKDGNMVIRMEGDDMFVEGDMGHKVFRVTTGEDGKQQIIISETKGREKKYLGEGSRVTTNTSSSRSRSDRESALPRGSSIRGGYEPAPEPERPMRQQRRVHYANDPRQYYRPERRF